MRTPEFSMRSKPMAVRIAARAGNAPGWMERATDHARAAGSFGRPLAAKKDGKVARLEIYDFIGYDAWTDTGISASDVSAAIDQAQADGAEELHVHINSPGGDVFEGVAIYNTIRRAKLKSTTYVDGVAASAASVIALAADHVVTGLGAMWMVHSPWAMIWTAGNADEIEKAAAGLVASLRKIGDEMASVYSRETKKPRAEVLGWMAGDTWMSGAEALAAGLTDEVESEACSCACAPCTDGNCAGCDCGGCDACASEMGCNEGECGQGGMKQADKPAAAEPAKVVAKSYEEACQQVRKARARAALMNPAPGQPAGRSNPASPAKFPTSTQQEGA